MNETFYKVIYQLFTSYVIIPKIKTLRIFHKKIYKVWYSELSEQQFIIWFLKDKMPAQVDCNYFLFHKDKNGYHYISKHSKRRLKPFPFQKITNEIKDIQDRFNKLKSFW